MAKTSRNAGKGKPVSKKTKAKQNNQNASDNKKKRSETFVLCPYTEQKVWISKATLSDLSKKKSDIHKNDKKRLWTIASSQTRHDHYAEVAQALSIFEQNLLPSSGGRSWEVSVQLSEPNARVLFRSWKGKMELACLPHLVDRIPQPPIWPGKRNQPADDYKAMQGEEEEESGRKRKRTKLDYIKGLADREISMLSQVAYDVLRLQYDHPVPSISIKWKSPDAKTFTSRKTAWEHATLLSKQEVQIDRNLLGIGASGKFLKEFYPSQKVSMEVGKLRFVRDGLWVVGQEFDWQEGREEALKIQEEELEEVASSKVYTSGLQLYVAEHRHAYREEHGTNLAQADKALRQQWRCLPPKEQDVWNTLVQKQFEDDDESSVENENVNNSDADTKDGNTASGDEAGSDEEDDESSVEYISPYQYFVQKRRQDYRHEQQMKLLAEGSTKKFTLAQADRELRQQWKEMEEEEQDQWIEKLEQMEADKENEGRKESKNLENADSGADKDASRSAETQPREVSIVESDMDTAPSSPSLSQTSQTIQVRTEPEIVEEKKTEDCSLPANVSETSSPVVSDVIECTKDKGKSTLNSSLQAKKLPMPKSNPRAEKSVPKQDVVRRKRQPSLKFCLNPRQIQMCHEACLEHYDTVMRTVKTRDLSRELADGFDVLRERGHGRFDMELPAFDTPDFDFLTNFQKTPWMPIVRAILGEDVVLIHKGSFMSLPGAGSQVYHQDGVHLTTQTQRPCHAINVFVPLVDLHSRNGPTEFVLGSHVLGHDGYDRDFLETPKPKAGTPVVFDYRLGHRGLANSSGSCRPIVYCTYARAADGKEFRDSVNFSRKRYHKIGELSAKPLSREERRNKRKRSIESALEQEAIEQAKRMEEAEPSSSSKEHQCKHEVPKEEEAGLCVEPILTTIVDKPLSKNPTITET